LREYFTSESVTEGHPDKLCDQISDSVLDEILEKDPAARVACECCATTGIVFVMGEITTNCYVDIQAVVRKTIKDIGYDKNSGFDPDTLGVITSIHEQSPDIALGVDCSLEKKSGGEMYDLIGAGDQGMMFGYACSETPELMPLAIMLSHKLAKRLAEVRKTGLLKYLRPDGKTQVTVEYERGRIKRVDTIVVSTQHSEEVSNETLKNDIKKYIIEEIIPKKYLDAETKIYINPTGRFEIGGPQGDSGLTGRKIIVDTYGGKCAHGGGAFSGKDPTKVDRSAAYMARYICKNIVAAGIARECTLEVAYAIGVAKPVSVLIDTKGTGKIDDEKIAAIVAKEFDLRPYAIIEKLNLRKPIYKKTAVYGHFGNEEFPWEKTDKAEQLKKYL
jgi:S-adenosylmethionine synthetase